MTGFGPGGRESTGRPFSADELPPTDDTLHGTEEREAQLRLARQLEDLARRDAAVPVGDLADRVMAAIAREPTPAPVRAARSAVGRRSLGAFLLALGDAWRVAFGAGRPLAVRGSALALVLVVLVAVGSGGAATAAALGLLDGPSPTPTLPSPQPSVPPSPVPSTPPSTPPSALPSPPSPSPSPSATPDETETAEPDATDDHGGGSGSDETERPDETEPTSTDDHDDDRTEKPGETDEHSDDAEDDSSGSGSGDD